MSKVNVTSFQTHLNNSPAQVYTFQFNPLTANSENNIWTKSISVQYERNHTWFKLQVQVQARTGKKVTFTLELANFWQLLKDLFVVVVFQA